MIRQSAGIPPALSVESDLNQEDCLFRIYKDTRFSRNKEPYKTNFGAFITDRGRKIARAGYYVHVEPGECLVAAGLYMPPAPELKAVRRAIADNPDRLRRILRARPFVRTFGKELPGPALKTAPRDFAKDHPAIDLLRYTSFCVWQELTDARVQSPRFVLESVKILRTSRDFVHYLNEALLEAHAELNLKDAMLRERS